MNTKVRFYQPRQHSFIGIEILETRVAPATLTWTGQSNNQWTNPGNWSPASQPADGDALIFDDSAASSGVLDNDTTPGNSYSLTFSASINNYTITGNSILLDNAGADIRQQGTSLVAINVDLSLLQAPDGGNPSVVNVTGGSDLFIGGAMTMGSGTFRKQGSGVLTLAGANSFAGTLAVDLGVIKLGANNTLPTTALSLQLTDSTSTLDMNGFSQTLSRVGGNGVVDNFSATAATLTLNDATNNSTPVQFLDTVGNLNLVKAGAGTLTVTGINGSSNLSGTKTVMAGALVVNGLFGGPGQMTVNAGATLGGVGNVSSPVVVVAGGNLAPAQGGTGVIGSGNLTLNSGATFSVNVNGNVPATSHDQVSLIGSVSLGNATLVTNGSVASNPGQQIVLIANDGSDSVSGTFNGIPEGGTVTINSVTFTMTYAGGVGGNDVVLVQSAPPAETALDLVGGDVIVTDALGGASNDNLFISLQSGGIVRFFDPSNTLGAGAGLTQVDANTVEIALASITGVINFNALGGDDDLTVDFTGGSPSPASGINFIGGNPTVALGDSLFIVSGAPGTHATNIAHNIINTFDGAVNIDGALINYSAIESVDDTLVATNRSYVFPNLAETISLFDNSGAGMKIAGPPAGGVAFANPTNSLTINGGGGNDTINVVSLSPTFGGALVINGNTGSESIVFPNALSLPGDLIIDTGTGSDSISFNAALTIAGNAVFTSGGGITFNNSVTMAVNKNLTVSALGTATGTINLANTNADLTATGTGAISLTTARNIVLASGASVMTVDGALTLSANQQVTATAGSFFGVEVSAGLIQATGTGVVTVSGKGGNSGDSQIGVILGGDIIGGTGAVTVTGVGGNSAGNFNYGTWVINPGSTIASGGGNITVSGTGGGSGASSANQGVIVQEGSIAAGGGGTVSVTGVGGTTNGNNNIGIRVGPAGSTISSGGGNVTVNGTGGGGSNAGQNVGVSVIDGGLITAGGVGAVAVTGLGGSATGFANYGVQVATTGAITSGGGSVTVNGTGGGSGTNNLQNGVVVNANGLITAGGTGAVMVTGQGGNGSGGSNQGIRVLDAGSRITSGGGNVIVTGTQGTASGSFGVQVETAGSVTTATNGGSITLVANSMDFTTASPVITAGTGNVMLRQNTNGTQINLGAADSAGVLGLTDAELDRITAGTLQIGDANSGAITVSAAITHANHLSLTTGAGVIFNQAVTMAANKNLTATALGTSNETINFATANADLATSGTGAISLTTVRNILMSTDGASVTTVNGDITMNANQQATQTAGDFMSFNAFPPSASGVLIHATGAGNITINARGGIDPAGVFTNGISIINTSVSTNTGSITMAGVGGQTLGVQNNGLQVHVGGIVESTGGGSINLTGTGGGGNSAPGTGQFMQGIRVLLGGIVRTTGAGNITLTGTGGAVGSASDNYGVRIDNAGAVTSSGSGTITINAIGGANNAPAFRTDTGTNRIGFDGTNTYTGNIIINADSMDIADAIIETTGTATLRQKTNGFPINLGAADSAGTLGLTDVELDQVTAGTVQIGDSNSGATTVSATISSAHHLILGPTVGFTPGGGFSYVLSGTGGAPVFSSIQVQGSITLTSGTLAIINSLTSAATVPISLIQINPGSPIGTFSGLPQGAALTVGNSSFTIDYAGPGGSVQLIPAALPPVITPGTIKLEDLDGTNGFTLVGDTNGDFTGQSVSGAGDINGDGVEDFIVGSSGNTGRAYVVYGNSAGFPSSLSLASLNGTNGFRIERPVGNDFLGISVSDAGDVNGDGRSDLLVSERQADATGATYVIFGKASNFAATLNVSNLNGSDGFKLSGSSLNDQGTHIASGAGDVNGDGAADIIIGISTALNSLGQSSGAAYVVFGHLAGAPFTATVDLSSLTGADGFKLTGEFTGALFGSSVGSAGDVNGDGRADILVGAKDAVRFGATTGAAYLVFGRNTAFQPSIAVSTLNGATGVKIYGLADGNHIGASVSSAGDMNSDGFTDILIGSSETSLSKAGSSYVIFGKALPFVSTFNLATLDGNNGFAIVGETSADRAGESVGSVGDFNGDTYADIVIGAPGVGAGTSFLVFGRPSGFAPTLQLASINGTTGFKYRGVGAGDASGSSVNGAGDVNGDGKNDLIIGARSAGAGVSTSGEAYIVYGSGASHAIPVASASGTAVTYADIDGDQIVITVNVGKITADMLIFDAAGHLSVVDLNASGTFKNGSSLTFTVTPNGGDGILNVGTISAPGIILGAVTVTGNLNKIDVGGTNPLKTAIRSLTVGSLGTLGGAYPAIGEEASITSTITGRIGKLTVNGDVSYATINVSGTLGIMNVTGSFIGTGAFTAAQIAGLAALGHGDIAHLGGGITLASSGLTAAKIGTIKLSGSLTTASIKSASTIASVKVAQDVHKSAVVAAGALRNMTISGSLTSDDPAQPSVITALASVANGKPAAAIGMTSFTVKGNVLNAIILIGYNSEFIATNSDAKVGSITVTGTWTASSFAVGIDDYTDDGFGRDDRPIFVGINGSDLTPSIISSIAKITIGGIADGNADTLAHFGITAEYIGNAKIAGVKLALNKTATDSLALGTTGNFRLVEVVEIPAS